VEIYERSADQENETLRRVVNSNGTGLSKRNGLAPFIYDETRDSTFVFVNGIFRRGISRSSQGLSGVLALDLNDAHANQRIRERDSRQSRAKFTGDNNGFELLNMALSPVASLSKSRAESI